MRSAEGSETKADCEDPMIKAACLIDDDSCPAECKESSSDEKEDTVVKSGDLAVSAKAADGKKALIGGVSDLDTITFKTSEDVTISSITLERYGYSTKEQVKSVQLEDEDGNIIADAKEINSKGQVKLTLKKDYKTVDGVFKATVVLTTNDGQAEGLADNEKFTNGSTIGFKVIAAESTAKNLNLDDYEPYTYDLVNYAGSAVKFSSRNSATKDYNFEANKLYEVAKFRVKAPSDSAILVKGFTLTDDKLAEDFNDVPTPDDDDDDTVTWKGNAIDADKYAKDVTVTVDGKEVSGLKWKINKDDELVVSFDEVEVAGKETATIAVNMSFNEEFDKFGESVQYYIAELSKFNATDKKTGTRVSQDNEGTIESLRENAKWTVYTFKWAKTKLSGTKLWTVNAAAGSTNVKVAEGNITIAEAIRWDVVVSVDANTIAAVDEMRLVINWEEYDWKKNINTGKVTFKWVEIEKSGKVEIRVDLKSTDEIDGITNVTFSESLNSGSFAGFKYDESGKAADGEITGSINISDIRIQAAKASLSNSKSTKVELVAGETNRKTIFEGTYEAKKGAVTLKNFEITATANMIINANANKQPTFYVTIDNDEYDAKWSVNDNKAIWDIDDIEVADGKSVKVKVEIEFTPDVDDITAYNTFNIALEGEDEDNNPAGAADEDTVRVEVVEQGTINVTDSSAKKTILLRSNRNLAEFTIKPSKSSDDEIILNTIEFTFESDAQDIDYTDLKFTIDDDDYTSTTNPAIVPAGAADTYVITQIGTSVPSKWVVVKVTLKSEPEEIAKVNLNISEINEKEINSEFSKYYVPATVKITQNNGKGKDTTTYTAVFDNDTSNTISNLKLYVSGACGTTYPDGIDSTADDTVGAGFCEVASKESLSESAEGNKLSANNADTSHSIAAVYYKVGNTPVTILKTEFENFFENAYSDDDLMVYSNKS